LLLGIFARGFESFKRFVLLGFSKVYILISTILCFDTWLLYTRSENVVENRKRKRFLLLLLILLPLLLFGGEFTCFFLRFFPSLETFLRIQKIGTEAAVSWKIFFSFHSLSCRNLRLP
jgi:hypothetical protein